MPTLPERVATLETENKAAKPLHERFQINLDGLNDRTARIETKVDRLLENGRPRAVAWPERIKASALPLGSGGGLVGLLWLALERFS